MTTIGMAHDRGRTMARSARLAGIIRQGPASVRCSPHEQSKRSDSTTRLDVEAVLAVLTPEQRAALAPHL